MKYDSGRGLLACLLALLAPCACRCQQRLPISIDDASIPCAASGKYFPAEGTAGTGGLNTGAMQAEWETMLLRHMGELSLYACGGVHAEPEYRFLWDRSLSEPIAVRLVVHEDGTGTLFTRELDHGTLPPPLPPGRKSQPYSWDEWFTVKLSKQTVLHAAEVRHVLDLFNGIDFPHEGPRKPDSTTDGSDWVFESRVQGRYRLVDFRNNPSPAARVCGLFLVQELSKIAIPPRAIY
jgi:hypothetical protein